MFTLGEYRLDNLKELLSEPLTELHVSDKVDNNFA